MSNSGTFKPGSTRGFQKGVSGNPNGKPKGLQRRVREAFGEDSIKILGLFRDIALGADPVGWASEDDPIPAVVRKACGQEIVDRVLGKATQVVDVTTGPEFRAVDMASLTEDQLAALAAIQFVEAPSVDDDVH